MARRITFSVWRSTVVAGAAALCLAAANIGLSELNAARDRQDLTTLDGNITQLKQAAQANSQSAAAQYQLALGYSYAAEVAIELRDKRKAQTYAESGMEAAQKAVAANGSNAEYHRVLGDLCGQVIPANPLLGAMKYGPCARDEINKAIQLDSKLALAYVSQGVGNYYLPSAMGGGIDLALKDFDKAISLNPKLAEAYVWKGVALHKGNQNAAAREALQKALQMNPGRVWAKQQLEKIPAQ
jgi:tetratricopeptide (TPR) repeat protein